MATVLPIKVICNPHTKRDGTNLISIQYCESPTKRTVLPTNIYIPREYWNLKQRIISNTLPISFGDVNKLNLGLNKEIRRAEEIVLLSNETNCNSPIEILRKFHASALTTDEIADKVKALVMKDGNLKTGPNLDFYFQIDQYVESKIKKVSKGMASIYRNMKEHLLEFEAFRVKPITFECLDLTFYEEFVDFLMFEYIQRRRKEKIIGLKVNTVGKTIKQFRIFLRNRIRKRIIPPIDMDGWKILEEEVDAVYVNWEEIKQIFEVDLTNYPHLVDHRNDFVLGCMTGLRFSDFSKLIKEDLRGICFIKSSRNLIIGW